MNKKNKWGGNGERRDWLSKEYKQWRKTVYQRDHYACRIPGCKSKIRINAHHIKKWASYPLLRYHVGNGITLCYKHHKEIEGREDEFVSLFLSILAKNKGFQFQNLIEKYKEKEGDSHEST